MGIKELLRPTPEKILFTLILSYVFVPVVEYNNFVECLCTDGTCPPTEWSSLATHHLGLGTERPIVGEHYDYVLIMLIPVYILVSIILGLITPKKPEKTVKKPKKVRKRKPKKK